MNKIKIPSDWHNLNEQDAKKYAKYLLKNYPNFQLDCTPYDREKQPGLIVTISGPDWSVQISKASSEKYKQGGRATDFWVVYGSGDYGYSYDGYEINGMPVFIDQHHEHWPDEYPLQDPLYKIVHELYTAVRARTVPTYDQQKQIERQQAKNKIAQNAKETLLKTMKACGDISTMVYNKYMEQVKS